MHAAFRGKLLEIFLFHIITGVYVRGYTHWVYY